MDLETVLKAVADYGCLMELNSQPSRLDLEDVALLAAQNEAYQLLSTPTRMRWKSWACWSSVSTRPAASGLEAKDVANTRSWPQLRRLLAAQTLNHREQFG